MFTKLALMASLCALKVAAQGSQEQTQEEIDAEQQRLWRERDTKISDPIVPYEAGTDAPTETQSLLTGSYLTRANTDTGEYYFGFEMSLTTAEPGHTFCQHARLLNESEIDSGYYQSFNTCATIIDANSNTSGNQNNQNNNNGDEPTSVNISSNYNWETKNFYGMTLLYYEADGTTHIDHINKEEQQAPNEEDGETFPMFLLQDNTQTVYQEGDAYKFTSRNVRPFTSDDSTFDLKTCMDVQFTGGWARFDANGNWVSGADGQMQNLKVTDGAIQLISTASAVIVSLSLMW